MSILITISLILGGLGTVLTVISLKSEKFENWIKVSGALLLILSVIMATIDSTNSAVKEDEFRKNVETEIDNLVIILSTMHESSSLTYQEINELADHLTDMKNLISESESNIYIEKPKFEIDFNEISDSIINIDIIVDKDNVTAIDKLYFKFDIPGKLRNYKVYYSDYIDNYQITNSMLAGSGYSGEIQTLAETVKFEFNKLYSSAFFRVKLNFLPTKQLPESYEFNTGDIVKAFKPSFLDLHDYCKVTFYWLESGNLLSSKYYINLKDKFSYIREDNEKMIEVLRWHKDSASIFKMEEKRRDW